MGMTLAEKILARASGRDEVKPGEFVTARIDLAMCHEALGMVSDGFRSAGAKKVWDSDKVVVMLDHYVPSPTVKTAEVHKKVRKDVKDLGIKHYYGESEGVCHQVLVEKGHVLPGRLVVATDSHTTTYGALGAAGTGIGFSEMAYVLATGELWFRVPETIRFEISGALSPLVTSKDVILSIAGTYSSEVAQYKSIEFTGSAAQNMTVASRMTMSNMAMELGAKFAFFEPDEQTLTYLKGLTRQPLTPFKSDRDALYEQTYRVDVTGLEPQIAIPYSVDNVKPISELEEVVINQAVVGSCTNGRLEDLQAAASILKGRAVHPDVRLLVIPASKSVYRDALKSGLLNVFLDANAIICNPSCGPCFGQHMGQLAAGETCVASINRNFRGRMGSDEAKVYLASSATVAASAIEGKIVDPRNFA
jgi:3-isopropylmalate/(R)-2-methylmalate dehydratase large subunit